jgi:type II secretory pathway pseudopilin PulG
LKQSGLTLVEFIVVVIAVGVLSGLLLDRVLPLIGRAEKVAFETVQSQIHSALLLEAAQRIARGEANEIFGLSGSNPIDLLLTPPGNYLGSYAWPEHDRLPRRVWYFDERQAHLVYRPGSQADVEFESGLANRIELAVEFVYRDRDLDGSFNPSVDRFDGLRLTAAHGFRWLDD